MKRYLVEIKKIDWIYKDNPEAEVLFNIDGANMIAFCHPCNFIEGEIVYVYFGIIEDEIPEAAFWEQNKFNKKAILPSESNTYSYYCYGQLESIHPVIINCGKISFDCGNWINDESTIGAYVYFVISRLDIFKEIR